MASSFLKLSTKRALKDGTYPIVIAVGHGRDLYLSTGMSCLADDWDARAQMVTGGKNAKQINAILKSQLAGVITSVMELRERGIFARLDNKQLKAMLADPAAEVPMAQGHSIGDMFDTVKGAKSKRTAELYDSTLVRLRGFCDVSRVTFDDINRLWLDTFAASMADLAPNTRSIHMRNLRAVNNYAIDCDITRNYPFRRYKMPVQTSRSRALAVDVLRDIADLPLGHNSIYRDIFMLTFLLIGINFVDLCSLTSVEDGRVNYIRAKTHKSYSIKVEPEAAAIIDRLRGETHLLYMLDHHKDYRSYYRQLRRGLDKVREAYNQTHTEAPLAELSTYWARHSWATVAAELDIPKETIAAALGHEMGNSVTSIYIDFDRRKVDAANRRVIDWVLYGKR